MKSNDASLGQKFRLECFLDCTTFLHIFRFVKPLAGVFYITLYVICMMIQRSSSDGIDIRYNAFSNN